jgi:carbamoyl-phosphate synthase small subunit
MFTNPFSNTPPKPSRQPKNATAAIILADGTIIWGKGVGATGHSVGEICFNTSMSGYQEILTDPSYAGQIITFTFPHIGNVGTNPEDIETVNPFARGLIIREDITAPSNWRSSKHFNDWLVQNNLIGICGVDTRALTTLIRDQGAPNGVIAHAPDGVFDIKALGQIAKDWSGLNGLDLAREVSCTQSYTWNETQWTLKSGYGVQEHPEFHVVAIDYGAKRNILRCLASAGCKVTVVPATSSPEDILRHNPDGVFLSNGPGDPAATGVYAVPVIQELLAKQIPIFGICLGHQLLALALGGQTSKMNLGHRGANHPVKDIHTGKVEITSQNHGFQVLPETLPNRSEVTHISLFDGSNEGLRVKDAPAFSVQYHPEASPGPEDSYYLFGRFIDMIRTSKQSKQAA